MKQTDAYLALPVPDLAGRIEAEHQAANQAARSALEHALECGRLLIEAKAGTGHGGWLPWLEANTTISARQAQRYMRLATAALEGKYDVASHLTVEGALAALASPKEQPVSDERPADYLPRDLAPIPQPGEGLANWFFVTDPPDPPDGVTDRAAWKVKHLVASVVAVLEPTLMPGFVWPAVLSASLPSAAWKREDCPFTGFWLGQKVLDAAGIKIGSYVCGENGACVPGVAAESAESILWHLFNVPVHYMRGRWRRYRCERQAENRYLPLSGLDPWDLENPLLDAARSGRGWPCEVTAVLAFAEDIRGAWAIDDRTDDDFVRELADRMGGEMVRIAAQ